jgi:hypothetical protein
MLEVTKMGLTATEYHALLRLDLNGFIERVFYELNPATGTSNRSPPTWKPAGEAKQSGSSSTSRRGP